jgi:putative flippase GtrA
MLRRFFRFNVVSALGMLIQLTALWLLADVAHVDVLIATTAAVGTAVVHNFFWHRRWTWADRAAARPAREFIRFASANGVISLGGNIAVMAVLVQGAGVYPVPANLAAIIVCGLANFWLGNAVVFRAAVLDLPSP